MDQNSKPWALMHLTRCSSCDRSSLSHFSAVNPVTSSRPGESADDSLPSAVQLAVAAVASMRITATTMRRQKTVEIEIPQAPPLLHASVCDDRRDKLARLNEGETSAACRKSLEGSGLKS